jgi:hypothetical protein
MKKLHWYGFVFLICTVSCRPSPDHSFPLKKYREMGIPDWSNGWTMRDYGDVLGTLRNIEYNEPFSLPRKGSRKSGELFEQLVNLNYKDFLFNDTLPLHEKAFRIQPFLHIQEEFCDIYANPLRLDEYYNRELVSLYISGLSLVQDMLDLAHQINESDDRRDISMRRGYHAIQYTYMAMVSNVLIEQSYFSHYREKDLEILSDSVVASLRRNMSWFDRPTAETIRDKLRVVVDSSSSERIRDEYSRLIDML